MLGVSTPLVQAAQRRRDGLQYLLSFGLGAILAAATTGTGAAALGELLQPWLASSIGTAVLVLGALLLAAADGHIGRLRTPSLRRQTDPMFFRRFGPRRAFLLWGLDIGTGISTIRITSLFWFALALASLAVPPIWAPAVLSTYGLALTLALAVVYAGATSRRGRPAIVALRAEPWTRAVSVSLLGASAVVLLLRALLG
jgi:hypothetical protein